MHSLRASSAGQSARRRATMPARMPVRSQTRWMLGAAACAVVVASLLLQGGADAPPTVPLHMAATGERERAPSRATRPATDVAMPNAIAAPAGDVPGASDDVGGADERT